MSFNESYKRWNAPKTNIYDASGKLKKGRTNQGYYRVKHTDKYVGNPNLVIYRSSYEFVFCRWCDFSPSILRWSSEPIKIPYYDRTSKLEECKAQGLDPNNPKNWVVKYYHTDFWVELDQGDGKVQRMFIEVKPSSKLKKPIPPSPNAPLKEIRQFNNAAKEYLTNESKFVAMNAWAERNNSIFRVFTEETLKRIAAKFWEEGINTTKNT